MTAVLLAATLLRPRPDGHAVHRHPQAMCGERVGMLHIYYIKTPAGQEEMNARGPGLNARERQIMLMCGGQRPLQVLIELFGESVVRELHELVVQGYLQAVRRLPDPTPHPAGVLQAAPDFASARLQTRLTHTRDFITVVAQSLGTTLARELVLAYSRTTDPEAVLTYAGGLLGLLFRAGDRSRTLRVGYKIADLLPRALVPQMVDRLLDGPNPDMAAALYEHLLSGQDVVSFDDGTL